MRRHHHDGTVGMDLEPEAAFVQFRPPIKCKDPEFGNPISCDTDDITDANDDHVKDIWNMTPVKVVVGGPTVNNEPPEEPVEEPMNAVGLSCQKTSRPRASTPSSGRCTRMARASS